jgi:hypothetical protein
MHETWVLLATESEETQGAETLEKVREGIRNQVRRRPLKTVVSSVACQYQPGPPTIFISLPLNKTKSSASSR